ARRLRAQRGELSCRRADQRREKWGPSLFFGPQSWSVRRETVDEASAAGLHERLLAASGGAVRGVPRLHVPRVCQSLPVEVADDRRALSALGPVAAGGVAARGGEHALGIGAGEDVVLVRRIAAALDRLALFIKCVLLVDLALGRMQVVYVARHDHAL